LTNYFPEAWPFILGGLFVVVVTLFPDGLVGILRKLCARKDEASAPGPAAPSPTAPRPGGAVT
jgi:urea transport system permease protein